MYFRETHQIIIKGWDDVTLPELANKFSLEEGVQTIDLEKRAPTGIIVLVVISSVVSVGTSLFSFYVLIIKSIPLFVAGSLFLLPVSLPSISTLVFPSDEGKQIKIFAIKLFEDTKNDSIPNSYL